MIRTRHALLLLLAALLLALAAGCGGGDDGGNGSGAGTTTTETTGSGEEDDGEGAGAEADPENVAYQGAYELCAEGTVEEIAGLYGIDPPDPEVVAEAIAEQVGGGLRPDDFEQGRLGCLAAFDEAG